MTYERKDGDMVLFQNNKRDKETQPTMRGELLLGGVTYEVACWTKLDKNGNKFLTGKVKVKELRNSASKPTEPPQSLNDDIPF